MRVLVVMDNLAGHQTPEAVLWMFAHGIMPLYTPLSGSLLNMAQSIQRILRVGTPRPTSTPAEIIALLEATVRAEVKTPLPLSGVEAGVAARPESAASSSAWRSAPVSPVRYADLPLDETDKDVKYSRLTSGTFQAFLHSR